MATSDLLPTITVLLATYNGRRWLPQQVESILGQEGVDVRIIALDDGSTDGTVEWLAEKAAAEARVTVLESTTPSGSAAANFFRLISRADLSGTDYVALADQDDIWMPCKLSRHAAILGGGGFAAVSSSITAFDSSGRRTLVRKSYPQRLFDFLTESPGPGSTFLMGLGLVALVRQVLDADPLASQADFHDSLIYAVARAHDWNWFIDPESTVDYRQHDHNVMGANVGRTSALSRLGLIRKKWHRGQAVLHAQVSIDVASGSTRAGIEKMLRLMTDGGIRSRFALAREAGQLRRRPRDQWAIGILIALGIW